MEKNPAPLRVYENNFDLDKPTFLYTLSGPGFFPSYHYSYRKL